MERDGLYGYFWEQKQLLSVQKRLQGFLGRKFIPKWDRMKAECVFVTVVITSLLVWVYGKGHLGVSF